MLIWLWLAFFFNQADRQVFSTVLPQIKESLEITDLQAGLLASVFTAALALTVPFAGYVGDVCNRARIITLAVLGWSIATMRSAWESEELQRTKVPGMRGRIAAGGAPTRYPEVRWSPR